MKKHLLVVALCTPLGACGGRGRIAAPPALFPMTQAWTAPVGEAIEGPLATDGVRIFVATRDGTLRGLDAATGALVWQLTGRSGLLAAAEGLLVVREAGGMVWAREPETGSARWKTESGVPGSIPPVVAGDRILVAGRGIASLEAATGRILWSVPEPEASAPPVASGGWVLVGEADGTLRARDAATGGSRWKRATGGPIVSPPLVDEARRVFLGTTGHRFVAFGLERGSTRWTWRLGADVRTPAALRRDTVLFATHEAVLYALKRSSGHLAWRATLPSRPLSGPLLRGTGVLVACHGARPSESFVLGFDGSTGRRIGEIKTPGEIQSGPLLLRDRLVIGLRDPRSIVALQLSGLTPSPPPAGPSRLP